MPMSWRNISAGTALLTLGVFHIVLASALPERPVTGTPGPSFFPLLIGVCVVALSLALVFRGVVELRSPRATGQYTGWTPSFRAFKALACFAAYLLLLTHAGFILASALFFAALMRLYGARSYVFTAAAAVCAPILIYAIFRYGFQVVLPRGLLDF